MKRDSKFILLADDNADDQSFIRDAFTYIKADVQVKIVDSGRDVVEDLKLMSDENLPSLIVLDYNMPELNGAEVLEMLSKESRYTHIPKILLSTSVFKKHVDQCLKSGASGYLLKPDNLFDWEKLARQMLLYIDGTAVGN